MQLLHINKWLGHQDYSGCPALAPSGPRFARSNSLPANMSNLSGSNPGIQPLTVSKLKTT